MYTFIGSVYPYRAKSGFLIWCRKQTWDPRVFSFIAQVIVAIETFHFNQHEQNNLTRYGTIHAVLYAMTSVFILRNFCFLTEKERSHTLKRCMLIQRQGMTVY